MSEHCFSPKLCTISWTGHEVCVAYGFVRSVLCMCMVRWGSINWVGSSINAGRFSFVPHIQGGTRVTEDIWHKCSSRLRSYGERHFKLSLLIISIEVWKARRGLLGQDMLAYLSCLGRKAAGSGWSKDMLPYPYRSRWLHQCTWDAQDILLSQLARKRTGTRALRSFRHIKVGRAPGWRDGYLTRCVT